MSEKYKALDGLYEFGRGLDPKLAVPATFTDTLFMPQSARKEVASYKMQPNAGRQPPVVGVYAMAAGCSHCDVKSKSANIQSWRIMSTPDLQPRADRNGGRLSFVLPGAMLVEFGSVIEAIRWATAVQRAIQESACKADHHQEQLRIGIDIVDTMAGKGSPVGDNLNRINSVAGLSKPGEILITSTALFCGEYNSFPKNEDSSLFDDYRIKKRLHLHRVMPVAAC